MVSKRQLRELSNRLWNQSRVSECLLANERDCSGRVIRAHSIQNNRILRRIASQGHVLSFTLVDALFSGDLASVGRRQATTFTGFCSRHDTSLFSPIENGDYITGNVEQNLVFAYRALARELVTKRTQINFFTRLAQEFPENLPLFAEMQLAAENSAEPLSGFKQRFDESLEMGDFSCLETRVIEFDVAYPLAVNSIFLPVKDFEGNTLQELDETPGRLPPRVSPLFLNIFPQGENTYVLLSNFKEDLELFGFLDEQLMRVPSDEQKIRLSKLIATYCENLAYSPETWMAWTDDERTSFVSELADMSSNVFGRISDNPNFNLFKYV